MILSFRCQRSRDFQKVMIVRKKDRLAAYSIMKLISVRSACHLLFQNRERVNTAPLQPLRYVNIDVFIGVDL